MHRRDLLAAIGAGAGSALLAGCTDGSSSGTPTDTATATPTATSTEASLPDGIYVQPFREGMAMQGMEAAGDFHVAFMYTTPHVFWNVNGTELSRTPKSGSIHAMAVVWDDSSGQVVPETGLSLQIEQGGELVSQEVIYPMLSQRMGYHYGGNFALDGDSEEQSSSGPAAQPQDGEYTARVSIGGIPESVALTGDYEGQFREPATAEISFEFTEAQRERVTSTKLDAYGTPGAVKPMEMEMLPQAVAPSRETLPGTVHGTPNSDDATLLTGSVSGDVAARFDADTYLYVSARTRYNDLVLPAMALSATVTRGGSEVHSGALTRTLDPDLGYHYGTDLDGLEPGDEITLSVGVPPQTARHEGYERAFLQMSDVTLTV